MATIPVTNPQLPFLGLIPGGLVPGRMIRINAYLLPDADRASFNLQCGPSIEDDEPLDDDVCLHVDIRPDENAIIRNHYSAENGWGYEERDCGNIIQPGTNFELLILAQHDCFKVAINGQHFCEFKHRLPMQQIQFLYACRDARVFSITLEGDDGQGSAPPPSQFYNPAAASLSY